MAPAMERESHQKKQPYLGRFIPLYFSMTSSHPHVTLNCHPDAGQDRVRTFIPDVALSILLEKKARGLNRGLFALVSAPFIAVMSP